jgi:hypothetical protein
MTVKEIGFIREIGENAFKRGITIDKCPFKNGTEGWLYWKVGWMKGFMDKNNTPYKEDIWS